jgi:hypothetical protein
VKMPRRPWYPPMQPRPDIFGLHHVTIIGRACESDAERRQRVAKVEAGVKAAFKTAIHHLGEDDARELFVRVLRRPKRAPGRRSRPNGTPAYWKLLTLRPKARASPGSPGGFAPKGPTLATRLGPLRSKSASCWRSERNASTVSASTRDVGGWQCGMKRQPYWKRQFRRRENARNDPLPLFSLGSRNRQKIITGAIG